MSLSSEELSKLLTKHWVEPMRRLAEKNPHLFEPVRIMVACGDGTEVDLCDISKPLSEIVESIDTKVNPNI